MDSENAAMAHNDPDAGAGKELGAAVCGDPAVPAGKNPNEQLITRPYVQGVDSLRDFWRNIMAILVPPALIIICWQGITRVGLFVIFFPEYNPIEAYSSLEQSILVWFPIAGATMAVLLLLVILLTSIRKRDSKRTVRPLNQLFGALVKLIAAVVTFFFMQFILFASNVIGTGLNPSVYVLSLSVLLTGIVVVAAATIDARLVASDPLTRLEDESAKTVSTLNNLESRFLFLRDNANREGAGSIAEATPDKLNGTVEREAGDTVEREAGDTVERETGDAAAQHAADLDRAWEAYRPMVVLLTPMMIVLALIILVAFGVADSVDYGAAIAILMIIALSLGVLSYVYLVSFRVITILAKPVSYYLKIWLYVSAIAAGMDLLGRAISFALVLVVAPFPKLLNASEPFIHDGGLLIAILFVLLGPRWYLSRLSKKGRSRPEPSDFFKRFSPTFRTVVGIHNHYSYRLDKIDSEITMLRNDREAAKNV